jgi:hypothetical protein
MTWRSGGIPPDLLFRSPRQGLLESLGPSIYGGTWPTASVPGQGHRCRVAVRAAVNRRTTSVPGPDLVLAMPVYHGDRLCPLDGQNVCDPAREGDWDSNETCVDDHVVLILLVVLPAAGE